jgi:hypothetical protein
VWSLATGRQEYRLYDPDEHYRNIAILGKTSSAVVRQDSTRAATWQERSIDLETGVAREPALRLRRQSLPLDEALDPSAVSCDGTALAVLGLNQSATVYDTASGRVLIGPLSGVPLLPQGLAVSSPDNQVFVAGGLAKIVPSHKPGGHMALSYSGVLFRDDASKTPLH